MRVVVIVVAALLTLGLAAFGVVAAQKAVKPGAQATLVATSFAGARNRARPRPRSPVSDVPRRRRSSKSQQTTRRRRLPLPSPAGRGRRYRVAENTVCCELAAPAPANATAAAERSRCAATSIAACDKPGGMGLSRIVEIDTTGGPAFGFEHFKQYDFLREKEVVLTFDDGPWPENTPAVLKALTDQLRQGHLLRDRRARHLASRDHQGGRRRRHDRRQPHLVAQGFGEEPLRQGHRAGEAGDRNGRKRRAYGGRRPDRAILPLPRPATYRRSC